MFVFWFTPLPPPLLPFTRRALFVVIIACLAAALLLYMRCRERQMVRLMRDAMKSLANTFVATGVVSLILYGLAYERVPYLSMRVFWIPLAIWVVWRAWKHWRRFTIQIPRIQRERAEREKFEQWLPKRKT